MDPKHDNVSDASSDSDSNMFSAFCGLASFVTNSKRVLIINRSLSLDEVSVLSSLLDSVGEIPRLVLRNELPPGSSTSLGPSIQRSSGIHTLTFGRNYRFHVALTPELFRTFAASAGSAVEQLSIKNVCIDEPDIYDSFERFTALRSLVVKAGGIRIDPIPSLFTGIGKIQAMESLEIAGFMFTGEVAEILVAALNGLPLITDLSISTGYIEVNIAYQIGNLVALGRIRRLRLDENHLNDDGIAKMVGAILASPRHRCELWDLDLSRNDIGPEGGKKIAELVACSPRLRGLNLQGNPIVEAVALGKIIQLRAQTLGELDVTGCKLESERVASVLNALRDFRVLHVLKIGDNNAGDPAARTLAQLLLSPCGRTLIELHAAQNGITEDGALTLARALAKAYKIRTLNMARNALMPHGAAAVLDALIMTSQVPMDTINFHGCKLEDVGAEAAGRLVQHRGCRYIDISDNNINVKGAKALADSVAVSACMIESLDLSFNPIWEKGTKYFLDKISQPRDRFVRKLSMMHTHMG